MLRVKPKPSARMRFGLALSVERSLPVVAPEPHNPDYWDTRKFVRGPPHRNFSCSISSDCSCSWSFWGWARFLRARVALQGRSTRFQKKLRRGSGFQCFNEPASGGPETHRAPHPPGPMRLRGTGQRQVDPRPLYVGIIPFGSDRARVP